MPAGDVAGLLCFAHGNGFPAGTYSVLLDGLRQRGYDVHAPALLGHDQRYPLGSGWSSLAQELADFAAPRIAERGRPAWLVGHSMGGYLSLMVACLHPRLGGHGVRGVLLLDSPLLGGWQAGAVALAKRTALMDRISPARSSRRRRQHWASVDEAVAHFARKPAFAVWQPQVLHDYVLHGTHGDAQGGRTLSFDRDVETHIYLNLPHNLARLLRRHPPPCPVAFIGGTESVEVGQVGLKLTRRVIGAQHPRRLCLTQGGHLFPMEHPLQTAELAHDLLLDMAAG